MQTFNERQLETNEKKIVATQHITYACVQQIKYEKSNETNQIDEKKEEKKILNQEIYIYAHMGKYWVVYFLN